MFINKKEKSIPSLKHERGRVTLNWSELNAIINGVSAVDQGSLAIRNRLDATRFARQYGFNLEDPVDINHIREVHKEAISFIEEFFLSQDAETLISPEVCHPDDVLDLLVYSSNYLNKSNVRQMWACALLKVMHGIFHIDHDFKLKHFDVIRDQVFESFNELIITEGTQHLLKGLGNVHIPLYFYEKKRNKGRSSILLKLLQKPHYVASDIYDHLGFRLVFETKSECLFALQQLRKQHLVTITNVKPFRSRNSLLDLKEAKRIFKKYRPLLDARESYPSAVLASMDEELEQAFAKNTNQEHNPHSSSEYRAIQVTARKMIHLPNLAAEKLAELLRLVSDQVELPPHLTSNQDLEDKNTIYFDFELQLLDKKSWIQSLYGPSSHAAYKERQRATARKRVLGPMLIKHLEERASMMQES